MLTQRRYVAYRFNRFTRAALYVSERPGEGGKDWGWHPDRTKAQPLSPYWVKRFKSDMRAVNDAAYVLPV